VSFNQQLFAKILKETRKEKMKIEEFAEHINKEQRTVARIESGSRLTTLPTFLDMCEVLDVTPDHLLLPCIKVNGINTSPTSYEQLIELISDMDTEEINLTLEILKSVHNYKQKK